MTCYHPLEGYRTPTGVVFSELRRHDILGRIDIPCGQCIGCRMRRASDWELRVMHESTLWPENCFVTLTYGRDKLPPGGSLCHRDFQLFMKRARKYLARPLRFYMCGEYGPLNQRPHYHACLFNAGFREDRIEAGKSGSGAVFYDSALLSKLWSHGRVSVQDLTPETASYCARYIMKKVLGQAAETAYRRTDADGVVWDVKPEYAAMSLKPGIGAGWFEKYSRDVFPHDRVVSRGAERKVPKYYDRLLKRAKLDMLENVQFLREVAGREAWQEQTPQRLAARETVHRARVSKLNRGDLS